uniref:Uncharacterized protein n=1 Tax=Panagrolaimus sp. PS1159 TaxID=55785 RepID=A0AC35GVB1_9BILA
MDLTIAFMKNPPSNGKSNGTEDDGMIVRDSKRAKFMATYCHQKFSMPDSFVFYMAKNPTTWKLYQKMVKTCQYFFVKNPILVIDKQLNHYGSQWTIAQTPYNMNQTTSKLWIALALTVSPKYSITAETKDQHILTSIVPKLYRFQKIVEIASKATRIHISHSTITSKTMEELLKIPHFSTLHEFNLNNVPEVFDIEAFYVHMKKNKTTNLSLGFDESISDEYKKRLDEITEEIITTNYKPAFFTYRGIGYARHKKLYNIFYSDYKNL